MHFRILKMIATSGFLTALECTKFDFGAPGDLTALPRPPSWFNWGLFLRGGEGKVRERRGRKGEEEVGEGQPDRKRGDRKSVV